MRAQVNPRTQKIMKGLLVVGVLIILSIVFSALMARNTRKRVIADYAISELRTYELGGWQQTVLLEGQSLDLPIILLLHGGPGLPTPFNIGASGAFPDITDNNIAVYWDQYGCGKNNATLTEDITVQDYVDMTVDLIKALKQDFPDNPLHVFGMNWGSYLAAEAAVEVPELITKVTTYGQILDKLYINDEVYAALNQAQLSTEERAQLESAFSAATVTGAHVKNVSMLIKKYTEGYEVKSNPAMTGKEMNEHFFALFTSPHYSLEDLEAVSKNGFTDNATFNAQLPLLDTRASLEQVTVPYTIIQGEKDIITATKRIEKFVKEANNPHLELIIMENSAYQPGPALLSYLK